MKKTPYNSETSVARHEAAHAVVAILTFKVRSQPSDDKTIWIQKNHESNQWYGEAEVDPNFSLGGSLCLAAGPVATALHMQCGKEIFLGWVRDARADVALLPYPDFPEPELGKQVQLKDPSKFGQVRWPKSFRGDFIGYGDDGFGKQSLAQNHRHALTEEFLGWAYDQLETHDKWSLICSVASALEAKALVLDRKVITFREIRAILAPYRPVRISFPQEMRQGAGPYFYSV